MHTMCSVVVAQDSKRRASFCSPARKVPSSISFTCAAGHQAEQELCTVCRDLDHREARWVPGFIQDFPHNLTRRHTCNNFSKVGETVTTRMCSERTPETITDPATCKSVPGSGRVLSASRRREARERQWSNSPCPHDEAMASCSLPVMRSSRPK